jgi:hypothetical protein
VIGAVVAVRCPFHVNLVVDESESAALMLAQGIKRNPAVTRTVASAATAIEDVRLWARRTSLRGQPG